MSGSPSPAGAAALQHQTSLEQLTAMARLARESHTVVHVVVARAPGVVEHGRALAGALGLECTADIRAGSIRICFRP